MKYPKQIFSFLLFISFVLNGQALSLPVKENNQQSISWLKKDKDKEKKRKEKEKLARQFYIQRQYDKVIDIFDELYWDYPNYSNYTYYTYSLIGTGNYEKAEKVIRHQIKKNPNMETLKIDLGSLMVSLGEKKKGEKIYNKVLEDMPKSEGKVKQIANRFSGKLEHDYALKAYFKGRELLDNDMLFSLDIAKIYEKKGEYELMFNEYLNLLNKDAKQMNRVTAQLQQTLNDDKEQEKSKFLFQALLKKVRKEPDNRIYNSLISWISIQQKDYETALIYTKALEKRFGYKGKKIFELGKIALENKDYEVAEKAFSFCMNHVEEKSRYYIESHILQMTAKYEKVISSKEKDQEELIKLESELQQLINQFMLSDAMIPAYIQLSEIKNYYLGKTDEATGMLLNILENKRKIGKKAESKLKIQLANLYLYNDNPWEATLLYSQVEKAMKNTPIGNQATYENAMLSYYIGEFDWAKAKFDILKASTSKLIANDALYMSLFLSENMFEDSTNVTLSSFAKADLLFLRKQIDKSLHMLDSLERFHNSDVLTDDILYKKAEIFESQGKYQEADSIYTKIYTEYNYDLLADNSLMNSIKLNLHVFKDEEKAKVLLKKMLKDYEGSLFMHEARIIFRKLRNDNVH